MSGSLAGKCGACHRWVKNGLIYKSCDSCFHVNCDSTSHSLIDKSMPWNYTSCRYQKHAIQQDERIRHLEEELKGAKLEITKL
jgi:hypothetical protein